MWKGTNLPVGREMTFGTPPLSVVLMLEIWGGLNPSAAGKMKQSTLPCSRVVSKDLQTPYSNCWSMNEFAAGPIPGGPEDEPEGCTGDTSFDSSTVGSDPEFPNTIGFNPGLLEPLGSASKD